jgi:predicted DNA-binding WGR domain protein
MTVWWHVDCLFESQRKGRANKRKIQSTSEIDAFDTLKKKDQDKLAGLIEAECGVKSEPTDWTYLRHSDGVKWWKIGINEDFSTMTKYGDIGSDGFAVTKAFASKSEAEKYKDKQIKSKLGSAGYVLSAEGAPFVVAQAPSHGAAEAKDDDVTAKAPAAVKTSAEVKTAAPGTTGAAEDIFGYKAEYAKSGRSGCKHCNDKIAEKSLRVAKLVQNPFVDHESIMPVWFHPPCLFENLKKGKQKRSQLTDAATIEGYDSLTPADQSYLQESVTAQGAVGTESEAKEQGIHLKNTSGENNKYWEISMQDGPGGDGTATMTRWGDNDAGIGAEGNYMKKDFDTPALAVAYRDKMVKSKLKGGYEVWSVDGVKVAEGERAEVKDAWMTGEVPAPCGGSGEDGGGGGGGVKKRSASVMSAAEGEEAPAATKKSRAAPKSKKSAPAPAPAADDAPAEAKDDGPGDVAIPEDLKSLKVPELKALCTAHGLAINGKKDDLVDRLKEHAKK